MPTHKAMLLRVASAIDVVRVADHSSMNTTQRLLCAALIAITACGGNAVTATTLEPAPTTTAAPLTTTTTISPSTTTTETTTTVDEIAAAGAHYLEIVAPGNCVIEQIEAIEVPAQSDGAFSAEEWDEMVDAGLLSLYAQGSEADIAFMEALAAYEWPENVQEDVNSLIQELSAAASWALDVSESQSFDDWLALWGNPPESVSAAVVRAKLGLESNIGSEVVDCPAA